MPDPLEEAIVDGRVGAVASGTSNNVARVEVRACHRKLLPAAAATEGVLVVVGQVDTHRMDSLHYHAPRRGAGANAGATSPVGVRCVPIVHAPASRCHDPDGAVVVDIGAS